jgi:single-stranded DNA-binding protein
MLTVLASGTLVSDPRQRQGANARAYATAAMRVPSEESESMLLSIITFNDTAVAALLALKKGDGLAVTGRAKLTSWEKNGEQRHGLSIVAEQIMTVYQHDMRRKRSQEQEKAVA